MKKVLFIVVAAVALMVSTSAFAQSEKDSLTFISTDWGWQDVGKGAVAGSAALTLFDAPQFISIVKYPMRRYKTYFTNDVEKECATTPVIAKKYGAKIACNGSYFNMRKLTPVTGFSIGREILGETTKGEQFRVTGAVIIKNRLKKKVLIQHADSASFYTLAKKYYAVLTSGPLLIKDGKTQDFPAKGSFFTGRHPRTIIGVKDGWVYMIDIDGRFKANGAGATIPETAAVARYLGLKDALNLDGGGSSTVWTEATGVLNHPNDNGKWDHAGCRKVPNTIIAK